MQTSIPQALASLAILLPAFLLAVSFHEFCHAFTAHLLGDNTARRQGRLTLNPLAHIDPVGLLCLLIFRFGWATPVPMNSNNFRHPYIYTVISALAGPAGNFVLALACLLIFRWLPVDLLSATAMHTLGQLLNVMADVNIMLGTFNLLPIPPLDGGHIIAAFLNRYYPRAAILLYRYAFFLLLLIFMLPPSQQLLNHATTTVGTFLRNIIF